MLTQTPGPLARALSQRARDAEAPGINTLYNDQDNILWQEARGANVLDVDGNRYLDFTSGFGVAAIGHRHPAVTRALRRQASRLVHGLGDAMGHASRIELAERLQDLVPVDDPQVYFAVSGADAVEIALKTLLLASDQRRIMVFDPSYHGLTMGALAASSRPRFRRPFAAQLSPHLERFPFAGDLNVIEEQLRSGEYGGVLLEPIVGREGILLPPTGWLHQLSILCHQYDVPLAVDEVFTGFGRTGAAFAVVHEAVRPDLMCCGKALAGGLPIGAVVARRDLFAAWPSAGEALHTATFVAHPLACATALATLEVLATEQLVSRAADWGEELKPRLSGWQERFPCCLAEVRGRGMLWGLEFHSATMAADLTRRARDEGLLLLAGGATGRVVQLVPPLNITRRQMYWALEKLASLLSTLGED